MCAKRVLVEECIGGSTDARYSLANLQSHDSLIIPAYTLEVPRGYLEKRAF